jgi:hypothetical protein
MAAFGATLAAGPNDAPEDIPATWARTNYRGRTVDLRGGPALAAGLLTAAARGVPDPVAGAGAMAAIGAAGIAGLADDLLGDGSAKGLRGHFRRLKRGQVTTGLVKLVVVGAGAALFAVANQEPQLGTVPNSGSRGRSGRAGRLARTAVDAVVVAGAANLVNLLDLRPGRALKAAGMPAALLAVAPGAGGELAAGVTGAVVAAAPADLGERTMLGDCGANALGAAVGVALVRSLPWAGRLAAAVGIGGLILASEKVSFSKVIAADPTLRRLDELGRDLDPDTGTPEPDRPRADRAHMSPQPDRDPADRIGGGSQSSRASRKGSAGIDGTEDRPQLDRPSEQTG